MEPSWVEAKFLGHIDALETLLAAQCWLVGAERTIADIAVGSQLTKIVRTSHLAPKIAQSPARHRMARPHGITTPPTEYFGASCQA